MNSPILLSIPKSNPVFRNYTGTDIQMENSGKSRKRRLDHLSWEEKLQRKKLKNRVAAQTSRDRKKAKMEEMEDTIKSLYDRNELLLKECRKLRDINKKLINENADLKSSCCCDKNRSVDCKSTTEPAVFTTPLPQGMEVQSAAILKRFRTTMIITNLILTYLISQTSSQNWTQRLTLINLRNSLRVYYKKSPKIWKEFLQKERIGKIVYKKITQEKWWGPHQSNWNPVDIKA